VTPVHERGIDFSVPSPARLYDCFLGGKDNFPADRAAAAKVIAAFPQAREVALANRGFLVRAVRFLAGRGVRQFIDLGTGIPTSPNVHEVARQIVPGARVVYVDNDPVVTSHSRALRATGDGVIAIEGDIREPGKILASPDLTALIDFGQPVAVLMIAVLHFIRSQEDPAGSVAGFAAPLAPGSYLAISHATSDGAAPDVLAAITDAYSSATAPAVFRRAAEIRALFAGFELADPGLVDVSQWRQDRLARPASIRLLAGVGQYAGSANVTSAWPARLCEH
jgi:hypothetical protein